MCLCIGYSVYDSYRYMYVYDNVKYRVETKHSIDSGPRGAGKAFDLPLHYEERIRKFVMSRPLNLTHTLCTQDSLVWSITHTHMQNTLTRSLAESPTIALVI